MKLFNNLAFFEKKKYLAYEGSISYKQLNNSINFIAEKISENTKTIKNCNYRGTIFTLIHLC